jgi:uncharacterized membrane protein YeaQ/YmgE (transglycosylase-associated protein family)
MQMDDHFWPSMYPGLFIGLIYGLAAGGWSNVALGCIGGLAGAIGSFFLLARLGLQEDFVTFASLILASLLGAYVLIAAVRAITGSKPLPKK